MESGEGPPKDENVPDTDEIPIEEDDPLNPDPHDIPLPPNDPYETTSYNPKFNDFLDTFKKDYKNSKMIESFRKNTLLELKSMRVNIFQNLYDKYLSDDLERDKILKNKDSYKPFESKNEDVKDFIELSKNISQLEKGVFTDINKQLMFLLGEKESTPTKDTLKKILDYLRDKKYPFLFSLSSCSYRILCRFRISTQQSEKSYK